MTDKRPRNPPSLWALLTIHWVPLPTIRPIPDSFTDTQKIKLVPRGNATWHAYSADPSTIVTHDIDLQTGTTASEAFADPPTDDYQPLETDFPALAPVNEWQPYRVAPLILPTAPNSTTCEISFSQKAPGLEVPDHVAACPGATGILGPNILENRKQGVNARSRPITCARPGLGQQQLNGRFARGAQYWAQMTPEQRGNWATVAKQRAPALTGYAYYLGFLLTLRSQVVQAMRRQTGLDLPLPPELP